MTREELRKKLSEIIHKKHPVPVYLIGGALGELQGCNAYEEETIREGMWRTKYLGVSYWFKGITDNEIIDRVTITKKAFMEIAKLMFPFGILFSKKIISVLPRIYRAEGGLKSKVLKLENFCPVCQELIRMGLKLAGENKPIIDLVYCFAMFLQFSSSYRVRVQDILGELDKDNFKKSALIEILRLKRISMGREKSEMKKMKFLWWLVFLVVFFKKRLAKRIVAELDIEKMKLDEADFYFCLRRSSYDFGGYQLATRLEIADKIDKEQGNLILGI